MFTINVNIKSIMMMMMDDDDSVELENHWNPVPMVVISRHWLCLSFHVCSKTYCELLVQTVKCKTFCSGVQLNSGYYQEIKAGNGTWHIYTVRYRIGIFCGNYRLSLPTVTPLHV